MDKRTKLAEIAEEIRKCRKCKVGKSGLSVPGEGNPDADIMFVERRPERKRQSAAGLSSVGQANCSGLP